LWPQRLPSSDPRKGAGYSVLQLYESLAIWLDARLRGAIWSRKVTVPSSITGLCYGDTAISENAEP
jgi:hypothetical protein